MHRFILEGCLNLHSGENLNTLVTSISTLGKSYAPYKLTKTVWWPKFANNLIVYECFLAIRTNLYMKNDVQYSSLKAILKVS